MNVSLRTGRRIVLAYAVSLALLLFLAAGWFVLLPLYRPSLRQGEVYGMDVSSHQKAVDWRQAYDDDIRFVYVKSTEGSSWQDPMFKAHWQGAAKAGLRTGAYHYFSLCSSGKTQAENFIRTVPKDAKALPPVLDLEFSPHCAAEPDQAELDKQVRAFTQRVSAASGKPVVLYVGDDFDAKYRIKERYKDADYWQLRYLKRPADPRDRIWQVGYFFRVDGAKGTVDLNVGNIDGL